MIARLCVTFQLRKEVVSGKGSRFLLCQCRRRIACTRSIRRSC